MSDMPDIERLRRIALRWNNALIASILVYMVGGGVFALLAAVALVGYRDIPTTVFFLLLIGALYAVMKTLERQRDVAAAALMRAAGKTVPNENTGATR